ncbi:MAG: hypothetical protein R2838_03580 [Caldilineaceae bacterium]
MRHYKANRQVATFAKPMPPAADPASRDEVHTPGVNTIAALAEFLGITEAETAKAVFMVAEVDGDEGIEERFVCRHPRLWNSTTGSDQRG